MLGEDQLISLGHHTAESECKNDREAGVLQETYGAQSYQQGGGPKFPNLFMESEESNDDS